MCTLANREDPDDALHNVAISSGSALFAQINLLLRERNVISFVFNS